VEPPLSVAELVGAVAVLELEPELVGAAPVPVPVGMGGVEVRVTPTEAQRPWANDSAACTSEPLQVVRMH